MKMEQWDFEVGNRKGSLHYVPDALSRIYEGGLVDAFEEIRDLGYLRIVREVQACPKKYAGWRVENGCLYKYKTNLLLNPIENREAG